jgi:hypothetical protein
MRSFFCFALLSCALFFISCDKDEDDLCIEFECLSEAEKDRVVSFVESAYDYYNTQGAEKALDEFSDPSGAFIDKELYIFVIHIEDYDTHIARVLAHGFQEELIGQNVYHLEDIYGTNIIEEQLAGTDNAENRGWSEFYWDNPETQKVGKKFAYIIRSGDLLFGSGTYR